MGLIKVMRSTAAAGVAACRTDLAAVDLVQGHGMAVRALASDSRDERIVG